MKVTVALVRARSTNGRPQILVDDDRLIDAPVTAENVAAGDGRGLAVQACKERPDGR